MRSNWSFFLLLVGCVFSLSLGCSADTIQVGDTSKEDIQTTEKNDAGSDAHSQSQCKHHLPNDAVCESDCECASQRCETCVNTEERECRSLCTSEMNCFVFTCDEEIGGECSFKVCVP